MDITMNNNTIEQQLQKITESILRLHDKLMTMPYSFEENKDNGFSVMPADYQKQWKTCL